ncbi:hypothetical protein ACWCQ1_13945 [Streptomyces sp. NPDC002144]
MTHHPDPAPNGLHTAPRGPVGREECGRKSDAEGVLSALSPSRNLNGPVAGDGRFPVAWLTIRAFRGATPTATSTCLCGRDRSAVGHRKVHALIADHETHRTTCPLRTTQERRNAA